MIASAEEFVALRCSEDPAEYHRAAHDEAGLAVWLEVIDKHPDMRFWVAQNKTVPLEILELLASDPDVRVRSFVAMKRKIGIDLLQRLAVDEDDAVRACVARHRRATPELIETLLHDESWVVRKAATEALAKRSGGDP
ncbi:HEAT repeat domain-containing protein [Arthrobacter sp. 18067]|uniref:HEAT repeat domain-containing protein n=1 Tax=Arthrobacter sp. 18067 TaxID=2681413 RepID=UPI00135C2085|nr:HEAT repeat domain-containing protein [Arthrobacter sp. 18067]